MASMLRGAEEYKNDPKVASGQMPAPWAKYVYDVKINLQVLKLEKHSSNKYYLLKDVKLGENDENNLIMLRGATPNRTNIKVLDKNLSKSDSSFYAYVEVLGRKGFINLNRIRKPTTTNLGEVNYSTSLLNEFFYEEGNENFNTREFSQICDELATQKKLPRYIKESSDLNAARIINKNFAGGKILNVKIKNTTFFNIIGCVPVTSKPSGIEPKADICLVRLENNKIEPAVFISYKLLKFKTYGGYTQAGEEGKRFKNDVDELRKTKPDVYFYRKMEDKTFMNKVLFGNDYGSGKHSGINNCDFIISAQTITISPTGELTVGPQGKIYRPGEIPQEGSGEELYFYYYPSQRKYSIVPRKEIAAKAEEI
jgi:hypothetical protein